VSIVLAEGGAIRLLVVDADLQDRTAMTEILRAEGYVVDGVFTAAEAKACLSRMVYDLMLVDIDLPDRSGLDLLAEVQLQEPGLPVILMSGQANVELARRALHLGASDFITKPCPRRELPIVVERNLIRRAVESKRALRHKQEAAASQESLLDALLTTLNTRDIEAHGHSERVTAYTMELADHMGIPPEELYHIERGALLHDIGNIGIPDRILMKRGQLTPAEREEMQKHPIIGYRMCVHVEMLKEAARITRHHHEAWDGSGYPDGLRGEAIPMGARLLTLADALDTMTSDRLYRTALPFAAAREEIMRQSGRQFDPAIVRVFLSIPEARWESLRILSYRLGQSAA